MANSSASTECLELRVAAHSSCALGENPLWHPEQERLYWCDIPAGRLFRHDPTSGATEVVLDGGGKPTRMIGGFTLEADDALLLFMAEGRIERWKDGRFEVVVESHPNIRDSRFNDVIADAEGRVFCGSMSTANAAGKLYRLGADRMLIPVVENVGCSNGLAFTSNGERLYYTDSTARTLTSFDYDSGDGSISNPQIFVESDARDGVPDGMTVDAEDHIWSAHWGGGFAVRYSPSGEEVRRISVPAPKVTSLTFGGPGLRTLFITTAGGDMQETDGKLAGDVFALEPGVCGIAEFRSRICSTTSRSNSC